MRILPIAAALMALAGCTWVGTSPSGQLKLSNYRFERAAIQAVVTAAPECGVPDPAAPATAFELPFKGTRVVEAVPGADICWRRQVPGGVWTDWNRAFTASGRYIDTQL